MVAQLASQGFEKQSKHSNYQINEAYQDMLLDLMCSAYANNKNLIITAPLDCVENQYLLQQFLDYATKHKSDSSISNSLTRYLPKHKPNERQSVDDFVGSVRFSKIDGKILLLVQPDSDEFKTYDLDFIAFLSSPSFQEKVLNKTH